MSCKFRVDRINKIYRITKIKRIDFMKKLKVMTVVGTRPEIIRLACVMKKLDASPAIEPKRSGLRIQDGIWEG